MSVPTLADTRAAIRRAADAELDRLAVRTFGRRLVHRIDEALDECELANLAGRGFGAPPRAAEELVAWLQEAAAEPIRRPGTAMAAHDELLRLQEPYIGTREYPGELAPALDSPRAVARAMSLADQIAAAHAPDCAAGRRRWYWPLDVEALPCTCGGEAR